MVKTVLVTGAAKGIGKEIAVKFAKNGYNVFVSYNTSAVKALELAEKYDNITVIKADVTKKNELENLINQVGNVDILVNNAGISEIKLFTDVTDEDFEKMMNVNFKSAFCLSQMVLPYMINKKNGRIINISSIWGICGASCEVLYSASKAALIGMTKALAKELAPSGITVNAVAPGVVKTDMMNCFSEEEIKDIEYDIPMGRMGTPEEIAETVFFLASENASYITGQVISPNGGYVV
ncbi:MAG: SDR family oxidoreductase [Clostridia bacterium]|nr:SDR family oxidoreductase [Clostridia bacterium]